MSGGSLKSVLGSTGPFPLPLISSITHQLLSALVYLHSKRSILHLDIKSDNILLQVDGQVKLTDFGSAVMNAPNAYNMIHDKRIIGTSFYMAPEMIKGKGFSAFADMW